MSFSMLHIDFNCLCISTSRNTGFFLQVYGHVFFKYYFVSKWIKVWWIQVLSFHRLAPGHYRKKRLEKTIRNFNDWILRYDLRISNFDKSCLTPSRYSVLTLLVRLLVNCSKWRRVIRVFHCYRRGKQLCVKNYNYSTSQNYLKRKLIKLTNIYARRWRLHAPIKFF